MKKILKSLFGYKIIVWLKAIKIKLLPSKYEVEFFRKQKELLDIRTEFYSNFVKGGDLCFDVGSNIGNRIDALLKLDAVIIAVEPQESCNFILEKKYANKIRIVKKGLGATEGIMDFHVSNTSVLSSFSTEWINSVKLSNRFENTNWNSVKKVQITTLDNLILEFGKPTFIKIDVEGFDLEVLKGLSQPIKVISFEYTTPEQTDKAIDCITHLEQVSNSIECNYCIGESMHLEMDDWLSSTEMKIHIQSNKFIKSGFGDVYVRTIKRIK